MHLADGAAALSAGDRIGLGAVWDVALVDLDDIFEERSIRIDHGAAQLLEHQPSGFVGADAELGLELQRRDAVGMAGDGVDRLEPRHQANFATVKDRACGDRGLATACGAFVGVRIPI